MSRIIHGLKDSNLDREWSPCRRSSRRSVSSYATPRVGTRSISRTCAGFMLDLSLSGGYVRCRWQLSASGGSLAPEITLAWRLDIFDATDGRCLQVFFTNTLNSQPQVTSERREVARAIRGSCPSMHRMRLANGDLIAERGLVGVAVPDKAPLRV